MRNAGLGEAQAGIKIAGRNTASAVLSGHQFRSLSSRFQGMNSHEKPPALVTWLPCITSPGQLTPSTVTTPWPGGGGGEHAVVQVTGWQDAPPGA